MRRCWTDLRRLSSLARAGGSSPSSNRRSAFYKILTEAQFLGRANKGSFLLAHAGLREISAIVVTYDPARVKSDSLERFGRSGFPRTRHDQIDSTDRKTALASNLLQRLRERRFNLDRDGARV